MFIGNFAGGGALVRALGIMAGISLAIGAARAAAAPLTLEDAWRLAEAANPTLRAAQAGLSASEGQLRDASGLLYNNPTLSTDQTSRRMNPSGQPENRFHEQAIGKDRKSVV